MEKTIRIKLVSVDDVRKFVSVVEKFDSDVDVLQGRYVIPASSIVGLFSLNLLDPLYAEIHSENSDEIGRFFANLEEFRDEN